MATIDELSIEVQSKAKNANDGIDTLSKGLEKLAGVVEKVQSGKLKSIGRGIEQLSNGMKGLKDVKLPNYTTLSKGLGKLTEIDSEKLKTISDALNPLANSIQTLSGANFDGKNIQGFVNSITRLSNANTESLKNINFTALGDSIKGLAGTLARAEKIQQNTISMTNAIAKLASAGEKANIAKDALPGLGNELKKFMETMSSAPKVAAETIQFTQAIGTLANAGKKAETTAGNLEKLGQETLKLIQSLSFAPKVSSNTISLVQALSQLANAGGRAGISSNNLSGNLGKLSKSMIGIRGSTIKAVTSLKSFATQIAASMGVYLGIYGAIRGIKKSIDISSDLVEVQNVVDVTFGNMTDKVEEFAQTSIKTFGMSELATKQYASRFQAMGTAMGISPSLIGNANKFLEQQTSGYVSISESMSDVSLNLTKLTADMASFYNVEQSVVAEKLASGIFGGQTRPLRDYGLDLTQATLAEWAMKNGLDADVKSMSQMEKTMLRYQYVLANTTASHGDFARTAGTWANQTRILKQQFEQLGSVIGGTFINAFKPFVATLNKVLAKVISFAETVSNALGKIFGWTIEISPGGMANVFGNIASDVDDAAGGADDLTDGLGGANDSAKKLQKTLSLLPFDRLNQLTGNKDTGSSGNGSGGKGSGSDGTGGASGEGALASLVKTDTIFDKYKSEIDTLYELGDYIGKALTKAMNNIDWNKVYQGARNFGKGLADFLNGLISPELFGAVGRTIAGALNTALHALDSFGETFNWKEFGLSIATGINEFFRTFDFKLFAKTINVWANGLLDTLITALDNTDWEMIGRQIGTFLAEIDFLKVAAKLGKALWKAINGAIKTYSSMFSKAPVETALLSLLVIPKALKAIVDVKFVKGLLNLANAAKLSILAFSGNATAIATLSSNFPKLSKAVGVASDAFLALKMGLADGQIGTGVITAMETVRNSLSNVQKGVIGAISVFAEFSLVKGGIYELATGTDNLSISLGKIAAGAGIAAAGLYLVTGSLPVAAAVTVLTGIVAGIQGIEEASEQRSEFEAFGESVSTLTERIRNGTDAIYDRLEASKEAVETVGIGEAQAAQRLADEYFALSEKQSRTNEETERMKGLGDLLVQQFPQLQDKYNTETGLIDGTRESIQQLIDTRLKEAQAEAIQNSLTQAYEAQNKAVKILNENADKYNTAQNEIAKAEENFRTITEREGQGSKQAQMAYVDLVNLKEKYGDVETSYNEAIDAYKQANSDIEYYMGALNETLTVGAKGASAEYVDGLAAGLNENAQKIIDSSESLGNDAVSGYRGALISHAGVVEAAFGMGKAAMNALQLSQNSNSPSKVTMALGKDAVQGYNLGFAQGTATTINAVKKWISDVINSISGFKTKFIEFGKACVISYKTGFDSQRELAVNSAKNVIKSITNTFPPFNAQFLQLGKTYMLNFKTGIENQRDSAINSARSVINALKSIFPSHTGDFRRYGSDYMKNLANGISGSSSDATRAAQSVASSIKSAFSSMSWDMYNSGRSVAQSFANGFSSVRIPTPHMYVSSWNTHDLGNGGRMSTPNFSVSWYKMGGLFYNPSVIGVGEAGKEAVLPLENSKVMGMIADSITENGSGFDKEGLVNAVVEGVVTAMMMNRQNQPPVHVDCYAELKTEDNEVLARAVAKGQDSIDYRMNPTPQYG